MKTFLPEVMSEVNVARAFACSALTARSPVMLAELTETPPPVRIATLPARMSLSSPIL
ncbi:hypothetical protein D3C83_244810 [compost metagenome]